MVDLMYIFTSFNIEKLCLLEAVLTGILTPNLHHFSIFVLSLKNTFLSMVNKHTHVVLKEVRVIPLNAVIQDGHYHIFACVASLPGPHNVHVWLAVIVIIVAMLQK